MSNAKHQAPRQSAGRPNSLVAAVGCMLLFSPASHWPTSVRFVPSSPLATVNACRLGRGILENHPTPSRIPRKSSRDPVIYRLSMRPTVRTARSQKLSSRSTATRCAIRIVAKSGFGRKERIMALVRPSGLTSSGRSLTACCDLASGTNASRTAQIAINRVMCPWFSTGGIRPTMLRQHVLELQRSA